MMTKKSLLFVMLAAATGVWGCEDVGRAPYVILSLEGTREQVVEVPFTVQVKAQANAGTYELEIVVPPDGALAPLPPAVAKKEVELSLTETTLDIPLLCTTVGLSNLVIASVGTSTRETRLASDDLEIDCLAPPMDTDGSSTTDDPSDTLSEESSGSGSSSDGSSGSDTDGPNADADVLAMDHGELLYEIILGNPSSISKGTPIEGVATKLRTEPDANDWKIMANYVMGAEAGVLSGRYLNGIGLDSLERFPIIGAQFLTDNAYNGMEFVVTDPDVGIWLFDGTTASPANTPEGARGLACNGMTCVGGASSGGFLRSLDGGLNWSAIAGTQNVGVLAFGNGLFVGYDDFNLEIVTSDDDGQTWTPGTFPNFQGISTIGFANGRFVGAGFDAVYYSDDGPTWQAGATPTMGFDEITYSERAQRWAGFSAANEFATSEDGVSWVAQKGVQGQTLFSTLGGL